LDYFRPDCESPARPDTFRERRAICNLTKHTNYVKALKKTFFLTIHTPVEAVQNLVSPAKSGGPDLCEIRGKPELGFVSSKLLRSWPANGIYSADVFVFFFTASAVHGGTTPFDGTLSCCLGRFQAMPGMVGLPSSRAAWRNSSRNPFCFKSSTANSFTCRRFLPVPSRSLWESRSEVP
jgi:hypothetical protein